MRGLEEHHKAVKAELSRYGITPKIEKTNGGHVRFTWDVGGKRLQIVAAGTTSDYRTKQNNIARVKRMMRDAGFDPDKESPPPLPKPLPPRALTTAPDERVARLEAACARLERQVETLLDLVTDPQRFVENYVPKLEATPPLAATMPPPPMPEPRAKPKKTQGGADCWLWRAMRYDKFLPVSEIAKAGGRSNGAASVMLTVWKAKGYVDHVGKGWRKNRKVEELGREDATHH